MTTIATLKNSICLVFVSASILMSPFVQAQTAIKEVWVRATVPQQKVTGAFMQITANTDAKLISAQSPVAGRVEIHTMEMDKDIMRMRQIESLDLPANKMVELKPGSFHIMLIDIKSQIKEGDTIPLSLVIESKDKKRETIEVKAEAKALGAKTKANSAASASHADHKM